MARLRLSSVVVRLAFVAVVVVILNVNLTLWRNSYTDTLHQSVKRMESMPLVKQLGEELHDLEARVEAIPFVRRIEDEISHALHFDRPTDAPVTVSSSSRSSSSSSSSALDKSSGSMSNMSSSISSSVSSSAAPVADAQQRTFTRSDGPIDTSLVEDLKLPAFASDFSEFVFGSMIERTAGSWDLHVTTLLLCHYMLEPHNSPLRSVRVHPAMKRDWRAAMAAFKRREVRYSSAGIRIQQKPDEKYYCRVSPAASAPTYTVQGTFMPNRLTVDANANQRVDVLRCPLSNPEALYREYASADSTAELTVDIIRGNVTLISFTVPWGRRKTGFLLSTPRSASRLDPWKGASRTSAAPPGEENEDLVHVCVPATNQHPYKTVLPMFMEFISHHLLLGADHIYFPVPFGWGSRDLNAFTSVFQSYVDEGKLTLMAHAWDGLEKFPSVHGMELVKHNLKLLQIATCLYATKGVARYLAVIDADEFFLPTGEHSTFHTLLAAVRGPVPTPVYDANMLPADKLEELEKAAERRKGGGRGMGWADGDGHPYCYISAPSRVVTKRKRTSHKVDPDQPWIGHHFSHGPDHPDDRQVRPLNSPYLAPIYSPYIAPYLLLLQGRRPPGATPI